MKKKWFGTAQKVTAGALTHCFAKKDELGHGVVRWLVSFLC